jgi:hypothetical protein
MTPGDDTSHRFLPGGSARRGLTIATRSRTNKCRHEQLTPLASKAGQARSTSACEVSHILADYRAEHLEGRADRGTYIVSRPVRGQQGGREIGI